jgi:hypothetical protein
MHFFSVTQCVGYLAFVTGVAAFLQKDDRRLKLLIAAECVAYTIHFGMLGNVTASLSAFVTCSRSLISLKTRSRWVAAVIIGVNIILGVACAKNAAAWLPIISSCLGTLAFFMLEGISMRLVLLVSTFLWLTNNILCGSIGGMLLETTIAIANFSTLIRLFLARASAAVPIRTDVEQLDA